ncbi:MAG: hypothetical protein UX95_C0014G0002 [Candidatus Woesebacteria bacterium GW2011_GWD1_47_21]|uniref:Uncharacterized protein n=6 Tax=Candidatus Woeseibacteriota TaxID=1752722 RepID=A0A0G1QQC8_9BACT|nr:MAG: hypothetical protein UX03_C0008G0019 [Candidatus Woesebacteria bacterium GW2011_GWE1_45_18]KKU47119.1 MAG: hypothetical protein UX67_C0049G0010 [Candidatus Woesebacteria bacterium GW2011_GWF2_46_8]KKU70793.1 MAG: hypothetical protein UX95_C0014G0002 [Candidatus Woesebacteria bacterium GW2011_GWD1_47_21]OGM84260.1 MAG: hypothetical protein A2376_01425 [Candidatus Woesebacteria bacterium RIFOXYB1_FULL_47_31]OGM86288.1 MAG: hypothetical protein A2435_03015 [Candidatus Woesebacteria bacteri
MSPDLGRFYPEVSGLNEEDVKDRLEVNPIDIEPGNVHLFGEVFKRILKSETGAVRITFPEINHEIDSNGLNEVVQTIQDGFEKVGLKLNTLIILGDGWHEYPEILISLKR